jgi:hypothetical protein
MTVLELTDHASMTRGAKLLPSGSCRQEISSVESVELPLYRIKNGEVDEALVVRRLIFIAQADVQGQLRQEANFVLKIEAVVVILEANPTVAFGELRGTAGVGDAEHQFSHGIACICGAGLIGEAILERQNAADPLPAEADDLCVKAETDTVLPLTTEEGLLAQI